MHPWLLLGVAIALEIAGTTSLKLSNGFTKLLPSLATSAAYMSSIAVLAVAVKRLEIGLAYAVWSGVGTTVVALIGIWFFDESASPLKLISICLVIAGVVGLNLSSSAH